MTNQHRATSEQWEFIERYADTYVEALEARPAIQPVALTPTDEELDELLTEIDHSGKALSWRAYARAALARWGTPAIQPVALTPTDEELDELVERVAIAIAAADDDGLTNMTWNYHARAAILEVAAWLRSELNVRNVADRLEQEARCATRGMVTDC
jgi:hypothetical protein